MKPVLAAAAALVLGAAVAAPAAAITRGGSLDGQDHPYVGIMVSSTYDADGELVPQSRCSGSLISPTVYVTAGHCTFGADSVEIWFETTLEPTPADFGYPYEGATSVTGTPYTHPEYDDAAFYLHDLGVVVLDEPVELDRYAELPQVGVVDTLPKGRNGAVVTAVGYGLQAASSNPVQPERNVAELTRYQADLFVLNTQGANGAGTASGNQSILLSGDAKHGGTCFGDSGGPALVGDTLVSVNSYGLNGNCAGVGGMFRIDQERELGFIRGFL
ncbi:trypsin-like serine protease [Aquipuribacter sp. SD81]|uniref:trypsin-like serine protease n=1 Tax=Aquipuribacter sp. SD81 TaxID=3127703 RepID=UPI00301588A5